MYMFLWIGLSVSPDWCMNVFGVQSAAQINTESSTLPELDNPISKRIRSLIESRRLGQPHYLRVSNQYTTHGF